MSSNWAEKFIQEEGRARIRKAIADAEMKTSGEIVPMVVHRSSTLGHVPVILTCLLLIIFFLSGLSEEQAIFLGPHPAWFLLDVGVASILGALLSRIEWLQRLLTSRQDMESQVEMRAEVEFYEADLHKTTGGTGILIFISLLEHRAVVLADDSIADKLPKDTWAGVVEKVLSGIRSGDPASGISEGIMMCGELVKKDFPRDPNDQNEVRDQLIIKE